MKKEQAVVDELGDGVTRRLLIHGGKLMAVEFSFKPGAEGKPHSHPHEQVGVFLRGRFEVTIGHYKKIALPGDSYYVAPNVVHGVKCLEDGAILDVFTPLREDFLPHE
ncbi:cupin domain-containing protein [Gemmatimonadota bacterium]